MYWMTGSTPDREARTVTSATEVATTALMTMYQELKSWNYIYELHALSPDPTTPVHIVVKSPSRYNFAIEIRVDSNGDLTLAQLYLDMGVKMSVPEPRVTSAGLSSRVHSLLTEKGA